MLVQGFRRMSRGQVSRGQQRGVEEGGIVLRNHSFRFDFLSWRLQSAGGGKEEASVDCIRRRDGFN